MTLTPTNQSQYNYINNKYCPYLSPHKPYTPFPDFHRLANKNILSYIIRDLNVRHIIFDDKGSNNLEKPLKPFQQGEHQTQDDKECKIKLCDML